MNDEEELTFGKFVTAELFLNIDKRNNSIYTRNGLSSNNQINCMNSSRSSDEFVKHKPDFSIYITP
ncbi:hypothetical protein [Fulvivirga sp.]|uniref:hypothetical protein n=1 Tax=Fulvivirga sp. TaxID=1931237 RepID=UPI0032EC6760